MMEGVGELRPAASGIRYRLRVRDALKTVFCVKNGYLRGRDEGIYLVLLLPNILALSSFISIQKRCVKGEEIDVKEYVY